MEVSRTIGVTTETDTLYGIERIRFDGSELNFVSANGFEDGKWVWKGTDDADTKQADSSNRDERIYGNAGSDTLMGGLEATILSAAQVMIYFTEIIVTAMLTKMKLD